MLHFNCRHLLAAGLDNGRITLYTWKPTADESSGWVLLAELDQRLETIKPYKFLCFTGKYHSAVSMRLISILKCGSVYGCSR